MDRNRRWLLCSLAFLAITPASLQAQQSGVPDWFLRLRLPNAAAKSIRTPAAWGAAYGVVFAGAGVTDRSPYLDSSDGVLSFGVGLGDPGRGVGHTVGERPALCGGLADALEAERRGDRDKRRAVLQVLEH